VLNCHSSYVDVANSLGLIVSFSKTKFLLTGCDVMEEHRLALVTDDNNIEYVSELPYVLKISNTKQQEEHITSAMVREKCGEMWRNVCV